MENEKAIYKPEEAETFVRRLAFVDWFAGVGGFRRGLELAGAECVGFCELDKYAYCSYVAMHCMTEKERESLKPLTLKARQKEILSNDKYLHGEWFAKDVRAVEPYDVPDADLWAFGFPCQDISIAGKQRGIVAGETRSGLFYEIARLLEGREEKDRPQWLIVENVKNILSINGGRDFLDVLNTLDSLGYDIEWNLHNSKNYGVPQNRERVYIVGHLRGRGRGKVFPLGRADSENPCNLKALNKQYQGLRVYDPSGIACTLLGGSHALGGKTGLYRVQPLKGGKDMPSEMGVVQDARIRRLTPRECFRLQGWSGENPAKLTQIADGGGQAQRVYDPSGLSRTLSALGGGQGAKTGLYAIDMGVRSGVFVGHRVRRLTPRECFRLQGWTDEYFERAQMVNSDAQLYIQAGNGVTVNVVRAIGERLV